MDAPVVLTGAGDLTSATVSNSSTLIGSKPGNTEDGDTLWAVVFTRNSSATWSTIPDAWATAGGASTSGTFGIFSKYIPNASIETETDYTWVSSAGGARGCVVIFRSTGTSGTSPLDAIGAAVTSGTSSIIDPAVSVVGEATTLVAVNVSNRSDTSSPVISPAGSMNEAVGVAMSSGSATSYLEIATQTLSASGTTGSRTATVSPAGTSAQGIMFTIAPGVTVDPPVLQTTSDDFSTVTVSNSAIMRLGPPAAMADGDVLWAQVTHRNSGATPTTIPPGWNLVPNSYTANGMLAVYWHYVDSAEDEPSMYTWRTSTGAGRGGIIMGRITGADPRALDSYGTGAAGTTTSITAGATTIASPSALVLAFYVSTISSVTTPVITPPVSMVEAKAQAIVTGSASTDMEVASQPIYATGSTGTRVATISPAASGSIGQLVAFAPVGYGIATPPQIIGRLCGGVTDTQAKISFVTKFTSSVRVAVSTSSDLSSPAYSSSVTPDFNGIGMVTITGLTANTVYYYGYELDDTLDTVHKGTFRTFPAAGTPYPFRFAVASCSDTDSNATTFDSIRTDTAPDGRTAQMFIHPGDMHYQDIGVNDQQWALAAWLNAIGQSRQQALWAAMPLAYTWSDHENGISNSDKNGPAAPAVQAVYRRLFPSYDLPADGIGIYQTWVIGRVRFIMTDGRSYMDPIANTDNSGKTKLGAAQKAWLKTQLTSSEPVKVWIHEDEWSGSATFGGDDTWTAYNTERAELAAYITSNHVNLLYIHGDLHVLAADDGSHVPGGFPVVSCSPLDQTPFNGNGTWSQGFSPNPATGSTKFNNYGAFDVHDDGKQIVIEFSGMASGSKVLGMTSGFGISKRIGWGAPI
jgi:hypothetical protein